MNWFDGLIIGKSPNSVLDYVFDWDDPDDSWLGTDTIASYVVTADTGLTIDSDSGDTTTVTVWLSGGTLDETYTLTCQITTAVGRVAERSITIDCGAAPGTVSIGGCGG
ncbi:MAG: hypothetical protein WBO93_08885 [Gammaproteobacteria bacterium]